MKALTVHIIFVHRKVYVDETVESDRSNECYQVVFSCGAVCCAMDEILNMDHSRAAFG